MTKDRLQQLQAAYKESRDDEEEEDEVTINIENKEGIYMEKFFNEVENMWKEIELIHDKVKLVHKKQSDILTDPALDEKLKEELSVIMDEIKYTAEGIRKRLNLMDHALQQEMQKNNMTAEIRIRRVQHSTLARKFLEIMQDYNAIQVEHREKCKDRIQRQLEITGTKYTDNEIEEMLETGNTSIFTQSINTEEQVAKQTLTEVKARHADIIKLEKSLRDLHELFLDMANLVDEQGKMVDRIENHVSNTRDYVEDAKETTKKAIKYQQSARKKKLIIIVVVIILIAVIALIIGLSTGL